MAKRKSLNRRSGRFSRVNADSGHLDPDTRLLGEEESFWWKNLEDNTVARRSTVLNLANETSRNLDPTYRLDSSKGKNEWWKMLETSGATRSERTIRHEEHASDAKDNNNDDASDSSESEREQLQKKKIPLRTSPRKSLRSNAFLMALDNSKESTASMPLSKTAYDFNNSATSNNAAETQSTRSLKSLGKKANHSQSIEIVLKQKPKLIGKRKMSKSRNMFDDVLKENVVDTSRTLPLQKSRVSEHQEGNTDNESIVLGEPRAGAFVLSFDNNDSESSNILVPKAQSTMLESTSVQINLSDSSISEKNVRKLKPKVLKWTAKSTQSNHFQDILANENNLEEPEANLRKSDLLNQKSQHKESSSVIPSTSIRESSAISNKSLSTSIQRRQKRSSLVTQNDAPQVDVGESEDSSLSDSTANVVYKPKSKFLSAWKKTNQQKHMTESHNTLGEELKNVEQSNVHVENAADESDTELFEAAHTKSSESNDEEPDYPAERRKSGDDSLSIKIRNKSTRVAASHMENSATFDELNLLLTKSKTSLRYSQKSMGRTRQRGSTILDDKVTESIDDFVNQETASNFVKDDLQDKIHKSKDAHDQKSSNSGESDSNDNTDKFKQSSRRSIRNKSLSHQISRTTLETRIVVEDDTRKEDDQVVGRTMRRSTRGVKIKSSQNSLFQDDTDNEDDQTIGQGSHNKESDSITSHPVRKGSKTGTTTVAQDDAHDKNDQVIRQSPRRSTYNKSRSRRISDSPQAAQTTNTLLPESDTDDKIVENKRRSSRIITHERSSRRKSESTTSRVSQTKISTITEDDADEEHAPVLRRSIRRSIYNKSSSRRISDSPSKLAEIGNTLLPASDTGDEIVANKRRSLRTGIRERSSHRVSESATSNASRTKTSTIVDDDTHEDDQLIVQNSRRSTRNKSSVTINQNVMDQENSVSVNELLVGTRSTSILSKKESMILVDGEKNQPRNKKSRGSMHNKSASTHIAQNPAEGTTKEKITVLDDDEDDEDETETFQLVTSRNGRSSTTSEGVGSNLPSRVLRERNSKLGVSYKDDQDLGVEADVDDTERLKSATIRKRSRISNVSNAKTTEENIGGTDTTNVEKDDDPSVHLTHPVTSSPIPSTFKHTLETSSGSENSDSEIITKSRRKNATMQSTLRKSRSDVLSTSNEEQTGEENETHYGKTIDRDSVNNPPGHNSPDPAAARNCSAKSTTNLRDVHSTQNNAGEDEVQDTAKSGTTVTSSLVKGDKVRDMSSINVSNISRRSPLLSSTRRSMLSAAPSKRMSKLPSQRSRKHSATDNSPISSPDRVMDDDSAVQEDERHELDNRKSRIRVSEVSESDQKKLSDGSKKTLNISQARASTSFPNTGGDEARQIGHRLHRVNNTIPEETSATYEESVQNRTEKEQSTRNQPPIAEQQNEANQSIEKSLTFNKSQENSQMKIPKGNATTLSIFGKKQPMADESRSKRMSEKSVIMERNLGKVFNQTESGTQRSIVDFLQGRTQKGFNRTLFSTRCDSQSQQPSASELLSDPLKREEFKKRMAEMSQAEEVVSMRKKPNLSPPKKVKSGKKVTRFLELNMQVKPKKSVHSAYLVNGKVYKPPPLPRPKYWVTNRLYRYLEKCLLPKYDMATRIRSEKFIKHLVTVTTLVTKQKKYDNYKHDVNRLMKEMAHLGIINNRNDFYHFCHTFLPYELREKLVPIIFPGNKQIIPDNPNELFTPLLKS